MSGRQAGAIRAVVLALYCPAAAMAWPTSVVAAAHAAIDKKAPKKKPLPPAPAAVPAGGPGLVLPGADSKQPVIIDADTLDYNAKQQTLVYRGAVVALQGESTLKASALTIFLQKNDAAPGAPADATVGAAGPPTSGSQVRKMEAEGPVTLISKDQVGTGDHATYDKLDNKVYLDGNVTLTQCANVTQGDRLIYDMKTGFAQVFSGQTNNGRLRSVFASSTGSSEVAAGCKDAGQKNQASAEKPAGARKTGPAATSASTHPPTEAEAQ